MKRPHCRWCAEGQKVAAGLCWCACHVDGESMEVEPKLSWQERAELLRRLHEKGMTPARP